MARILPAFILFLDKVFLSEIFQLNPFVSVDLNVHIIKTYLYLYIYMHVFEIE